MNWWEVIYGLFIGAITTVIFYSLLRLVFDRKYVISVLNHYKRKVQFYRSAWKWRKSIDDIVTQEETIESYTFYVISNLASDIDERTLRIILRRLHDKQQAEANITINITADSKDPSLRKALIRIPYHCTAGYNILSFNNIKLNDSGKKLSVKEVKKRKDLLRKDFKWVSPKPKVMSSSERVSDDKNWNPAVSSEYLLIDGGNCIMDISSKSVCSVLENSDEAGIQRMVLTCSCFKEIKQAIKLCEQYPGYMYFTAGVHPSEVDQWRENSLAVLENYAEHPQCVAIGECGLGYMVSTREQEIKMFRQQIELACKLQKPLWFCSILADSILIPILREYKGQLKAMCIGKYQPSFDTFLLRIPRIWEVLEMGSYISVSTIFSEPCVYGKTWFKDLLKKGLISPHKIILASKAPSTLLPDLDYEDFCRQMLPDEIKYLQESTVDNYGFDPDHEMDSEPGNLTILLEIVASCMNIPPKKLASAVYKNAQEFFNFG